jgi:hypothetical protein
MESVPAVSSSRLPRVLVVSSPLARAALLALLKHTGQRPLVILTPVMAQLTHAVVLAA